jgi:hypothetical protein
MYPFRSTLGRYMLIPAMVLFSRVTPAQASPDATAPPPPASGDCTNLPHADHPMARISNGKLNAVIFLPNKEHGYYRASRFDWAGVVGCASLNGHTFFGEWFNHYDPMANDAVAGPVEEFRNPTSELAATKRRQVEPLSRSALELSSVSIALHTTTVAPTPFWIMGNGR